MSGRRPSSRHLEDVSAPSPSIPFLIVGCRKPSDLDDHIGRGIDLAEDVLEVLATAVPEIRFIRENIRLEQSLYATEEAYRLTVDEGIPFREAYRRVGGRYRPTED